MSNYEGKLGEWLKYVRQQVEAVGKQPEEAEPEKAGEAEAPEETQEFQPGDVVVRDRLGRMSPRDAAGLDASSVIVDSSFIDERPEVLDRRAAIFEEADIPEVEDYLPFLKEPEAEGERAPEPEPPSDQGLLFVPEGTGEPKAVIPKPVELPEEEPAPPPKMPKPALRQQVAPPAAPDSTEIRELWDKLPRHIQLLVGRHPREVAQSSYKRFKETREELVARLLDPPLTLEETARILNVCPTTIRRYTNRGALKHFRTAGNQRRFRLSDVLAFLESMARPAVGLETGLQEK